MVKTWKVNRPIETLWYCPECDTFTTRCNDYKDQENKPHRCSNIVKSNHHQECICNTHMKRVDLHWVAEVMNLVVKLKNSDKN